MEASFVIRSNFGALIKASSIPVTFVSVPAIRGPWDYFLGDIQTPYSIYNGEMGCSRHNYFV